MSPAGNSVLLDTSVVIDHFRGDPRIHQALESAAALYMMRRFLRAVLDIGADAQTSEQYGPIPENDIWIAAVALQHGWPLATRDEHFGRITGLEILFW